ncbi:hypothetical protein SASPL_112908 [Salvia splendens]|uniref:ATPase AAA-type core domain-containing protein n=1 Tax=Salvia splendens TaxID=180675 RepID=A0A8X8Y918_SALSN|nr:hypothetical protein SASPL_112908 [Salvia splendens]
MTLAVGYALTSGNNSVVKTLYEYNADFSAEDDEGMIPFNYLPSGVEYDELRLLCQIVEEPKDYGECGMKGKMNEFNFELSKILGLDELKAQLRKWAKGMLLAEKRRAMGVDLGPRKAPHMAFLGNPGTGKTTVARILGKLLCSLGVLSSDKVTEVQRSDLVGEFLGQTGPKTRKKAMGGILFVDEAYRLTPTDSGSSIEYGVEALEEIMSVLEDCDLLMIFAGYTEPMRRVFPSNAGFCRRMTHFFQFDDFSCRELAEMVMIKMSNQDERSRLFRFRLGSCYGVESVA